MELFGAKLIRELLSLSKVLDKEESIVGHFIGNVRFIQLLGQSTMPIEIDLQAKQHPREYSHITKAKLFIDKVNVIRHLLWVDRIEFSCVVLSCHAR